MMGLDPPLSMRKTPPEHLKTDQLDLNPKMSPTTNLPNEPNDDITHSHDLDQPFHPNILTSPSPYLDDSHHKWLSILLKTTSPVDPVTLANASLRSSFSIVVKMHNLSEPWTRVIARKVRKRSWEILDEFGESVLDTVEDSGDTRISDLWGIWFKQPHVCDYRNAIHSDLKRKATRETRDAELKESPLRKKLRDDAYGAMINQGRAMKKAAQQKSTMQSFAVGTVVQVPLHDVDTTKADGKNLTLVVVDVVKKRTVIVLCIAWLAMLVFLTHSTIQATWWPFNQHLQFWG
jgi:hypothetical protein